MYKETFGKLGAKVLEEESSEEYSVNQIVSELNIQFSDEYVALLDYFNGSIVFNNGAIYRPNIKSPVDSVDGFQSLDILYGLRGNFNLIKKNRVYREQIPIGLVVIGESIGGNQICISCDDGKIYFWYHEAEMENTTLFEIAASIDDFLLGLLCDDASTSNNNREIDESDSYLNF